MKAFLLCLPCIFYACTPSANNKNNNPKIGLSGETTAQDLATGSEVKPVEFPPEPEVEGGAAPTPASVNACANAPLVTSDHPLLVTRESGTGNFIIDFENPGDRALRAIALYITAADDAVPTFENGFEFSGVAYWMVSLDDPFETFFRLPVTYGTLPSPGIDVTEGYQGEVGGFRLDTLLQPTCLKITVITFEPEEQQSFKTSAFLLSYGA